MASERCGSSCAQEQSERALAASQLLCWAAESTPRRKAGTSEDVVICRLDLPKLGLPGSEREAGAQGVR